MSLNADTAADQIAARLYEGILEPSAWAAGLRRLQVQLQCAAFHQLDIRREDRSLQTVATSLGASEAPSEKVLEFERHYFPQDIRMPAIWQTYEGDTWWDQQHFNASIFRQAPIYTEFLASLGLRHMVSVPLRDGTESRDFVGFIRHLDQKPFGTDEQTLVVQLLPHMVRANKLRYRTTQLAGQAALGLAALDALPQALAVADAGLRPRYLNAAAERAMAGPGGLTLCHGALRASDPAAQCHLEQCVATACGQGGLVRAGAVRITQTDGTQAPEPTTVQVLPLQASHPLALTMHGIPHALLVWALPWGMQRAAHLGATLGLTDSESRLALMLAQGHTVKDFALLQGCSWHTARTHAKNLLRKTGCKRQVDVARLVQGLVGV